MSAYTLSANTNIDALSPARTGGDTVDTNGFNFTIDQDTRGALGGGAGFSFGNMTINATKGGNINIDATGVRWIAYTAGSGNVPAWGTTITNGTGSGKLIGVFASLTVASTATGAAMPATGFIKVKQATGAYTSGALTGITATSSGADVAGWIEVVGDEAGTINANRLGAVNITGAWFQIGTTNGTANQTMQVPNNGTLRYVAGVFIEKTVGSNDYEFYPNNGVNTTTGTEAQRGKVIWADNTGLVRIGNSGAATNGYTPITGLKVVVPNIFLENCTTAARTANVIPNATVATRYDFTSTGGGVINIDKANIAWYPSFSQPYSVSVTNSGIIDALLISECASPVVLNKVGVGNKPTTALVVAPLSLTLCFAGGTISNCVFNRVATAANSSTSVILTDLDGFTFSNNIYLYGALRAHTLPTTITATRVNNTTFNTDTIIDGQISLVTCTNLTMNNTAYIGGISGTTGTTNPCTAINLSSNCLNVKVDGLTLPVTNNHPYTGVISIAAAGCTNIKVRNIGTRVAPLNLGSANASGYFIALATGAAANDVRVQRVYVSNTRTNFMTADNSSTKITMDNFAGDYADAADVSAGLNMVQRAYGGTKALTAQTSVYGTHFVDFFTSTTVGRLSILMNEPTTLTASQVSLSGGAAFTSAGGLYMPTIGQSATFEMPAYMICHLSFQNSALIMAGGTATNYNYNFSIDKNDGAGWSTLTTNNYTATTLATALSALTGLSEVNGFRLRLKITTTVTNTTAITSVYMLTNTSATAQDNQYPLDTITLSLSGLQTGSDVVILQAGTETVRAQADSVSSFSYTYSSIESVDIGVFKIGYVPFYIRNYSLTANNTSLPVAQIIDRNYLNP